MDQALADDIFLLALTPEGGCRGSKPDTEYALVAAWLTELVKRGRADVGESVYVRDATPTGESDLDWALAQLSEGPERKTYDWLLRLRNPSWGEVAKKLCGKGIIRESRERVLWVFPVTRYYVVDETPHQEVNERFRRIIVDGAHPDAYNAALVKLLHAARMSTRLSDMLFPDKYSTRDKWQAERRMKEVAQDDKWADSVLGPAIEHIESALWKRTRPTSGGQ